MLREREVVTAVLSRHSYGEAEKFIQEVCWRTYWKGWLEMRPQVWSRYQAELGRLQCELHENESLAQRHERAIAGHTGIECLDCWSEELVTTGYLHNHARMWFASIWIFTLDLPWQLGADFFFRHLLDGDPASNTLSWRWVAGLQTRGKHYLARPDNIEKYSGGRFAPVTGLSSGAGPREEPQRDEPLALRSADRAAPSGRVGLLVLDHDLHPESLDITRVDAVAGLSLAADRSPLESSRLVVNFSSAALDDGLARARAHFSLEPTAVSRLRRVEDIVGWATAGSIDTVICAAVPVGPARDRIDTLRTELAAVGKSLLELRRRWDQQAWPHARHGFFRFKKHIPAILDPSGDLFPPVTGQV